MTDKKTAVIFARVPTELRDRLKVFADERSAGKPGRWSMGAAARYLLERSLNQLESRK